MERQTLIDKVSQTINAALHDGELFDERSSQHLREYDPELYDQIIETYHTAVEPGEFYHVPIWQLGDHFEQSYELMRITFTPDVLDPRSAYVENMRDRAEPPKNSVMVGRFWRVSGRQTYTPEGQLSHFEFDPMTSTESIAAVIMGGYISLKERADRPIGMGAISYLATRPALRQGRGHGTALSEALEAAMHRCAERNGEKLQYIVLESEARARPFWAKKGYRYPRNSRYIQPPLEYDPRTGEPIRNPAPEAFMVKFMDGTQPECIDREELVMLVRTIYERWYSPTLNSPEATERVRRYVFDELLVQFEESVAGSGENVDLIWPLIV